MEERTLCCRPVDFLFNSPLLILVKNVVLLGSTGSIGTSTVIVVEDLPGRFRLIGLAAGNNAELLLTQAREHQPLAVSIADPKKVGDVQAALGTTPVYSGAEGLLKLATMPEADIVLISPAITRISFDATAMSLPARIAARAGCNPAVPTIAINTMSASGIVASFNKPSAPE